MGTGLRAIAPFILGTAAVAGFSPLAAETLSYGYDALGRLVGVGRLGGPSNGFRSQFVLDKADNRKQYYFYDVRITIPKGQVAKSPDKRVTLSMQTDGNLVVTFNGTVLWSSQTNGKNVKQAMFQNDGNFVLYDDNMKPVWWTGTNGKIGANMALQNDGNLVIYDVSGAAVWSTGTGGHT